MVFASTYLRLIKQQKIYIKVNPKSVERLIDIISSLHDTENHFEFSPQFAKRRIHITQAYEK